MARPAARCWPRDAELGAPARVQHLPQLLSASFQLRRACCAHRSSKRRERRAERSAMTFPTKSVPLAVACALASLVIAACGGSGSNANANANSAQQNEQQVVNFARCM